ncbi:MAG TPA: peptidoglycan DD-metalloendopeptidase family protein [Acidimicrobiia bacterium]|nr:peptidoglycan DD-metalloendopeptidase family protein [Acidimicrobiia bacterium]
MRRSLFTGLLACLVLALVVPVGAQSRNLDEVQREIDQLTSQINNARAESRRVGEDLASARARLTEIQGALGVAEANVAAKQAEIAAQEARVAELEGQLREIELQLLETTQAIDETSRTLALQAVEMYMNAAMPVGTMVLGFESVSDLAVGWTYADGVTGHSEDLLDSFEFLRSEEQRQRAQVEEHRSEAATILVELDIERVELEAELAEVAAMRDEAETELASVENLLASIRSDIAAAEQHKDGLEADLARIEAEIRAAQRDDGVAPGRLRMPVHGWISSYYGWRVHPIFGTRRMHTGIDLAAIGGTPIYAAEAGTVIIAGVRGGYGNAVVIDHGGGLATLYAHQSRITVSVGERVAAGERIGFVGCTGYCTGDHLHFEVHVNGKHTDPLPYLRG